MHQHMSHQSKLYQHCNICKFETKLEDEIRTQTDTYVYKTKKQHHKVLCHAKGGKAHILRSLTNIMAATIQ